MRFWTLSAIGASAERRRKKYDADLIAFLEDRENVSGYIKNLLRREMTAAPGSPMAIGCTAEGQDGEREEEDEANSKEFEDKLRTEHTLLEDIEELGVSEAAKRKIDRRIRDIEETLE